MADTLYLYKKVYGKRVIYFISPCNNQAISRFNKWVLVWDIHDERTDWILYRGGNLLDTPGLALWAACKVEDVASRLELLIATGRTPECVLKEFETEMDESNEIAAI